MTVALKALALRAAQAGESKSGRLLTMSTETSVEGMVRRCFIADVARLEATVLPDDPQCWAMPMGGDPMATFDVGQANLALASGISVHVAARVLAARALARSYGQNVVRRAVRGLECWR